MSSAFERCACHPQSDREQVAARRGDGDGDGGLTDGAADRQPWDFKPLPPDSGCAADAAFGSARQAQRSGGRRRLRNGEEHAGNGHVRGRRNSPSPPIGVATCVAAVAMEVIPGAIAGTT